MEPDRAAKNTNGKSRVRLPRSRRLKRKGPGASPGVNIQELAEIPSGKHPARVTVIDYGPDNVETTQVTDIDAFAAKPRPDWTHVRWINVDGITDMHVIGLIAEHYHLHPLAIEDLLHVHQRPKVDTYRAGDPNDHVHLFVVMRMMQLKDKHLSSEQVSMFLGRHTVITFQERLGDVWDPIRQRIDHAGSNLRINDASYLMYSLLDAVVDYGFPILDFYSDRLEALEDEIVADPDDGSMTRLHELKHEILMFRREIWPMRELIGTLERDQTGLVSDNTRLYLRDVHDHAVQVVDLIETYRDLAASLRDLYMTTMSKRMNEVMKVLTIIATIFIPITFLTGVWGMNMDTVPLLHWRWSFVTFCVVCAAITLWMLIYFKRKRWM